MLYVHTKQKWSVTFKLPYANRLTNIKNGNLLAWNSPNLNVF